MSPAFKMLEDKLCLTRDECKKCHSHRHAIGSLTEIGSAATVFNSRGELVRCLLNAQAHAQSSLCVRGPDR